MEMSPPNNRFPQTPHSRFSTKKGRSGYEPSDTETEWQEIPRHERERKNLNLGPEGTKTLTLMNKSPIALHRRYPSRFENEVSPPSTGPRRRHQSKSPYRLHIVDDSDASSSFIAGSNMHRNISPLPRPDLGRTVSPYNRNHEQRTPSEKTNYRRAVTAPRLREQPSNYGKTLQQNGGRTKDMVLKQREASPFKAPSVGEINEMIAQVKLSTNPTSDYSSVLESTESIQPGDLFFSRECNALQGKNSSLQKSLQQYGYFSPRPPPVTTINLMRAPTENGSVNMNNIRGTSSNNVLSRSTTGTISRKGSGTGKPSSSASVTSDVSGKTSESIRKFISNRKKSQKDAWFSCMMRTGNCRTTRKSPERRPIDEASFIERAIVVESLPQFWADKHQPASLNGFICNKQEAQLLKELVSQGSCPHILLKGSAGSGKRELAMALLREIYGDACCNPSHDLRHFPIQDKRTMKVSVPITSSSHHMELNVNSEPNAKYALMGLIKEISNIYAITPEVSNINFKSDYKVIVLYEVDKAVENIQHMIKWIIDRYSDICKLVLCCEDDADIIGPVKNRFKVIKVDAPQTHEITEVLIQIAKKEEIDLPMNFAMRIATKANHNLREAIMALEVCKAHNYPFSEEQPIPVGWENVVIEVAAEILADPSFSRQEISLSILFSMLITGLIEG
ncbi:P-loop containing nucleoside triphosphate hydrolase [Sesbania bispinosa]|nr:P-loop containing nucleoside triphosphate hydrolase [Sesbania bispinosa]